MRQLSGRVVLLLSLAISISLSYGNFSEMRKALRASPLAYILQSVPGEPESPQLSSEVAVSPNPITRPEITAGMVVQHVRTGDRYFVFGVDEGRKTVNVIGYDSSCCTVAVDDLRILKSKVPVKVRAPRIVPSHRLYILQKYSGHYLVHSELYNIVFVSPAVGADHLQYNRFMARAYPRIVRNVERLSALKAGFERWLTPQSSEGFAGEWQSLVNTCLLPYLAENQNLPKNLISLLLAEASKLFEGEPAFPSISVDPALERLVIVENLNGSLPQLNRLIRKNGFPGEQTRYIFNGNFIEPSAQSFNCLLALAALKMTAPKSVFINTGTSELPLLEPAGLGSSSAVAEFLQALPLGHVVNQKIVVLPNVVGAALDPESLNGTIDRFDVSGNAIHFREQYASFAKSSAREFRHEANDCCSVIVLSDAPHGNL